MGPVTPSLPPSAGPTPLSWEERGDWGAQRPPFPGTEDLRPTEIFSGPGYQAPHSSTDPVAVIALVLGVLSPIPGAGLLALAAGVWALRRLRGRWANGLGMAWFGVVIGSTACVTWLWAWLIAITA